MTSHPGGAHEKRDANIRSIVIFGIGLAVLIPAAMLAMRLLFGVLASRPEPAPPPSPMSEKRELPPAPRLQITPAEDLQRMRMAEDAVLSSYAWVDQKSGVVRIPIDRAMDLVAQRGLADRRGAAKR